MIRQVPGGPAGRRDFLARFGPCRHLGLARKSLVQTGRNFKSPFQTVRFRAGSKPDWPDYWDPWSVSAASRAKGFSACTAASAKRAKVEERNPEAEAYYSRSGDRAQKATELPERAKR
jgi:hypothetical protein